VWQGFIIILESFSYKDSLFILATKRKEDFRINSTFRLDFLVYLELLCCYPIFDPCFDKFSEKSKNSEKH
jgi:hypothetical protein